MPRGCSDLLSAAGEQSVAAPRHSRDGVLAEQTGLAICLVPRLRSSILSTNPGTPCPVRKPSDCCPVHQPAQHQLTVAVAFSIGIAAVSHDSVPCLRFGPRRKRELSVQLGRTIYKHMVFTATANAISPPANAILPPAPTPLCRHHCAATRRLTPRVCRQVVIDLSGWCVEHHSPTSASTAGMQVSRPPRRP